MANVTPTTCGHTPHCAKGLCKKCYRRTFEREKDRERLRAWQEANREKTREYARAYAAKNRAQEADKARRWRAANPERAREMNRTWYFANKEAVRAYREANAERLAAQQRTHRKTNLDRRRAQNKAWREANPERNRVKVSRRRALRLATVNDLTFEHWLMILAQFGHRCFYCGADDLPLQMEHMTPLSRGGAHTAGNTVPACWPCNGRKSTKTAEEFLGLI